VPTVRLTEVFRQAADSRIITNAHRIRRRQMPDVRGAERASDFHFVERDEPENIAATLVKLVKERIPQRFGLDPIRDVQVLCPMNRGSLGVRELTTALQQVLNPVRAGEPTVERFGWRFQMRDKVIQTENDYDKDVFNGDIGTIERIDAEEHEVTIRFDERRVAYDFGELDEVSLAYAVTIHKSQGSEFPRGDPDCLAALHAAAAQPDLYGDHPGEEAGRAWRAEEGAGHRGAERPARSGGIRGFSSGYEATGNRRQDRRP
jgi:exodeoxyribonuclease V alpha subunit